MTEDRQHDPRALAAHIDDLLQELCGDARTRAAAEDLVRSLMEFYGSAFERALALLWERENGAEILARLGDDPLVASVLLIHDLHPTLSEPPADDLRAGAPLLQIQRADGTPLGATRPAAGSPRT